MIIKRKEGWHVISESGKNLGGPYQSRQHAVQRLRQVEYFKHNKTAGVFTPDTKVYSKALIGRANSGSFMFPHEKKLVKQLAPITDKNTYDKERFNASVSGSALKTGLIDGTVIVGGRMVLLPHLAKHIAKIPIDGETAGVYDKYIRTALGKTPPVFKDIVTNLSHYPLNKALRTVGYMTAGTAGLTLAKRLLYPDTIRNKAKKEHNTPELFIRNRLREKMAGFPIGILDDAAYLAAKATQQVTEEKKPKSVEPKKQVRKDIRNLEKQAANEFGAAINAVISHPKTQQLADKTKKLMAPATTHVKDIDEVGKHFYPGMRKLIAPSLALPIPGTSEAAIGAYGGASLLTREMAKRPWLQATVTRLSKAFPI